MDPLVSTNWLAGELGAADLRVIDATVFLPGAEREARAEYEAAHIPGAVFMNLDEIVDTAHPAPHMLPPASVFADHMVRLGIGDGNRIVIYDDSPLHSAARAWWMLKAYGANDVAVLDGGLGKWKAEGRLLESGGPAIQPAHFTPVLDQDMLADLGFVRAIIPANECEIVDARSPGRFTGEEAEPRPGLVAGHIPGAKNLPQAQCFNPDNSWKRGPELRAAFEAAGVDLAKPMVTSCGSGVTAAVLLFGARLLGKEDVRLYDGSWAEWGADPTTPKAVGRA